MFATVRLLDGRSAYFEFGTPLDPKLTHRQVLERMLSDYQRRRDELWDVPVHIGSKILTDMLDETADDPPRLATVIRALGEQVWDDPATKIEPLVEHPDRDVRIAAIGTLGRMGRFSSIKIIGPSILSDDRDVRRETTIALGKYAIPALPIGGMQAAGQDEELRQLSTEALRRAHAQAAADHNATITAVIETGQWQDLLGWIGFIRPNLIKAARSFLNSDEARARAYAILAIHQTRSFAAGGAPLLAEESISLEARRQLAVGLGRSRVSEAVKPLIELLDHEDLSIQEAAIVALGRIGRSAAVDPLLIHWGECNSPQYPMTLVALRRLSSVDGAKHLLTALESESSVSVTTAAFFNDEYECDQQLPQSWLQMQLSSPHPQARRDAALLLAIFGDSSHAAALKSLANSETDSEIQNIAELGAGRLKRRAKTEPEKFSPWPVES